MTDSNWGFEAIGPGAKHVSARQDEFSWWQLEAWRGTRGASESLPKVPALLCLTSRRGLYWVLGQQPPRTPARPSRGPQSAPTPLIYVSDD